MKEAPTAANLQPIELSPRVRLVKCEPKLLLNRGFVAQISSFAYVEARKINSLARAARVDITAAGPGQIRARMVRGTVSFNFS